MIGIIYFSLVACCVRIFMLGLRAGLTFAENACPATMLDHIYLQRSQTKGSVKTRKGLKGQVFRRFTLLAGIKSDRSAPEVMMMYRFGLCVADFLICPKCMVTIAAVIGKGGKIFSTVNVAGLQIASFLDIEEGSIAYDAERAQSRISRRYENGHRHDILTISWPKLFSAPMKRNARCPHRS